MMVSIPSMRLDIHVPHVTATGDDYHHNRYKKTSERKRPKPHPRYYSYNNDSSVSGNINDKSECRRPCLPSPRRPCIRLERSQSEHRRCCHRPKLRKKYPYL